MWCTSKKVEPSCLANVSCRQPGISHVPAALAIAPATTSGRLTKSTTILSFRWGFPDALLALAITTEGSSLLASSKPPSLAEEG